MSILEYEDHHPDDPSDPNPNEITLDKSQLPHHPSKLEQEISDQLLRMLTQTKSGGGSILSNQL